MSSRIRTFQVHALATVALAAAALGGAAQAEEPPARLRVLPQWSAGEKVSYQVQQVVKERGSGKDETRFLSNGTLDITAIAADGDSVTFEWHRRMDNAEQEMVREPWGIRGNAASEKLINNLVQNGLPIRVRLNLRNQRMTVVNRDDVSEAVRRSLQSLGGSFSRQAVAPPSAPSGNPEAGIHRPLVKRDNNRVALNPGAAGAVAYWYIRLAEFEIADLLGALGREYALHAATPGPTGLTATYRPTGANELLLMLITAPDKPEPGAQVAEQDKDGEPANVGLGGGAPRPATFDAKIEVALPSAWPKRAAILRAEDATSGTQTTMRRVYLRK
ncbi:MAG: hypothetical protein JNK75_00610 [Betaproteobacteria bacterium]|nr:hypothetical protein [Betaproteobacteria bacterium]